MTKTKQDRRMIPVHSRRWIVLNFKNHPIEFFMKKYGCGRHTIRCIFYEAGLFRMVLEYWTEEQVAYLKANYKTIGDLELAAIFNARWKKDKGWTKKHMEKKRKYLNLKRTKEEIAAIKAKHILNGAYKTGKTWDSRGRAPEGALRNWREQCVMMKVNGKFIPAARCIFEAVFGPIPEGHIIKAIDGDNYNLDPLNLELYTRSEGAILNKFGPGSTELKQFVITLSKFNKKLQELENQKKLIMKLIIEISCKDGHEMEDNLNLAIDDFGEALKKKGFREMELIGYKDDVMTEPIYKINLKPKHAGKQTSCEKADN